MTVYCYEIFIVLGPLRTLTFGFVLDGICIEFRLAVNKAIN